MASPGKHIQADECAARGLKAIVPYEDNTNRFLPGRDGHKCAELLH